MLRLNAEIIDTFSNEDLSGTIRFGVPDDYAVKLLPIILSSFQRTHPRISVDVRCLASEDLLDGMSSGRFDLIVFTQGTSHEFGELFRTESACSGSPHPRDTALHQDPLPLACGTKRCFWRAGATEALSRAGIDFRIAYTSSNATAIIGAVMSDLAVGYLPESALQPGMKVITQADKYPLPPSQ